MSENGNEKVEGDEEYKKMNECVANEWMNEWTGVEIYWCVKLQLLTQLQ